MKDGLTAAVFPPPALSGSGSTVGPLTMHWVPLSPVSPSSRISQRYMFGSSSIVTAAPYVKKIKPPVFFFIGTCVIESLTSNLHAQHEAHGNLSTKSIAG